MADHPYGRPFEDADAVFRRNGDLLFSVAQSMLGDSGEAASVVREVREWWFGEAGRHAPDSPAALFRQTAYQSLARLRAARSDGDGGREHIGPWLPDSLMDEPDMTIAEAISAAMSVMLDALRPEERTVFVLRHGFGLSDADIAAVTGGDGVQNAGGEARVRCEAPPIDDSELAGRFVSACTAQDRPVLRDVLAPDVILKSGGQAARHVTGREPVADALLARFAGEPPRGWSPALDSDGLVVVWAKAPSTIGAVLLQTADGTVTEIDLIDRRVG